jgi:DNA polymerase-3 subunit alpha
MATARLEDMEGSVEVVVFPEPYQRFGAALVQDQPVLVSGEVSRQQEATRILAWEVHPLPEAPRHFAKRLSVHIPAAGVRDDKLQAVRRLLSEYPGVVPVGICLQFPGGEKVFLDADASLRVNPDEALVHRLQQELGEESVYVSVNKSVSRDGSARGRRKTWARNGENGS